MNRSSVFGHLHGIQGLCTLNRMNTRINTGLIVSILAITFLGAGCTQGTIGDEYAKTSSTEPWTVNNASLAGRPPMAFPKGVSDDVILAEIRAHLDGVTKRSPDAVVSGFVFLNQTITLEEMGKWSEEYGLSGGKNSAFQIKLFNGGVGGFSISPESHSAQDFVSDIQKADVLHKDNSYPTMSTPVVSFSLYGPLKEFQRLWSEQSAVRGIGVLGLRGQDNVAWYPIGVGDPFRP